MEITYHGAAIAELAQNIAAAGSQLIRTRDRLSSEYDANLNKFNRLRSEGQDRLYQARNALASAQSALDAADAQISRAQNDSDGDSDANMNSAVQMRAQAMQEKMKAQAEVNRMKNLLSQLDEAWQSCGAPGQTMMMELEDGMTAFSALVGNSQSDLQSYTRHMEQARSALYGESGAPGSLGAGSGGTDTAAQPMPGWCSKNSMQAVHMGTNGTKQVSLTIMGNRQVFPCTKAGTARAYRAAVRSGDQDMIARTAAMYEVETIRESLELTSGAPGVPQLGGYHGDVRKQDAPGFESHHIPSKAVQKVQADRLPALSISNADHKKTSSYSGKQNRRMKYGYSENVTYKQAMAERIGVGGSGYIEAIRNELLDLKVIAGNRYDGGISGYLDAVIDMLATRGIPKSE